MQDQENPKYFECACTTPEHTLRFCPLLEEGEIYLHTQLRDHNFFGRLKIALLYLFFPSRKQWEETILDLKTIEDLKNFLNDFLEKKKNV